MTARTADGVGRAPWLLAVLAVLTALAAPWPFASVDPFWSDLFAGIAILVAVPALIGVGIRQLGAAAHGAGAGEAGLPRRALVLLALLPVVPLLSCVPLPEALFRLLNPSGASLLDSAAPPGVAAWRALSLHPSASLDAAVLAAGCAAVAWLVARAAVHPRARSIVLWTFIVGGVVLAAFGLAQRLYRPDPQVMFWSIEIYEVGTPFGPYVNRNHFAGAMLLFAGVTCGAGLQHLADGRRRAATVAATALGLILVALLATTSRGAALGAMTAGVVLVVAAPRRRRLHVCGAVVAAGLLALGALAATGLLDDFASRLVDFQIRWADQFHAQRSALRTFVSFPMFGTGAGTFPDVFHLFQTSGPGEYFGDAHSDWVQILMELGLLGAAYVILAAREVFSRVRRAFQVSAPGRHVAIGAAAGCVGICAHGLVETNLHIPANALLFACAVAIAYGASVRATDSGGDASSPRRTS